MEICVLLSILNKKAGIFCLLLISVCANAQQKPYILDFGDLNINNTSLKKQITLVRQDACRNKTNDTLAVYFYNTKGQKNRSLTYEKNKLYYATNTTFNDDNKVLLHSTFYNDKTRGEGIIKFGYKNKREVSLGNYDLGLKKDTLYKNLGTKQYDKNGNLIAEDTSLGLIKTYFYNSKNQKLAEIEGNKNNAYRKKTNYFYQDGLLVRTETYTSFVKPSDSALTESHDYIYNLKKLLVEEKYKNSSSKDEQFNQYFYNDENQLIRMKLAKGDYFMDVEYEYSSGKITRQFGSANTTYAFSEFYIPLSSCGLGANKSKFQYRADYVYDAKSNLIKLDRYVNDKLIISTEYILEYY
ncbi:MAG: hypothetical protein QM710_07950 [Flavobacterium sp.]